MQWIREVLAWLSLIVLVWACWQAWDAKLHAFFLLPTGKQHADKTLQTPLVWDAANAASNPIIAPLIIAVAVLRRIFSTTSSVVVGVTVVGFLVGFSGLLVTLYQETGILDWAISSMPTGSTIPGVRQAYQAFTALVPMEVFLGHLVIYLSFRVLLTIAFIVAGIALRLIFA